MKEIPLLFTPANRDLARKGLKTEARREMKEQPQPIETVDIEAGKIISHPDKLKLPRSPYGWPQREQTRYWMKEPVQVLGHVEGDDFEIRIKYLDDGAIRDVAITDEDLTKLDNRKDKYVPSTAMFMLKSFARTWLPGVRVWPERLGDMSEESALAEGIEWEWVNPEAMYDSEKIFHFLGEHYSDDPLAVYEAIWKSINGPDSWDPEKWVWAIKFEKPEEAIADV